MHSDGAERHLSPEQLAEREGVPIGTVYQWNRRRTGPDYMRIGKHVRYQLADVIAWELTRYSGRQEAHQ